MNFLAEMELCFFCLRGIYFPNPPPLLYSVTVPTPPDLGPKPVPTHDRGAGRVGFLRRLGLWTEWAKPAWRISTRAGFLFLLGFHISLGDFQSIFLSDKYCTLSPEKKRVILSFFNSNPEVAPDFKRGQIETRKRLLSKSAVRIGPLHQKALDQNIFKQCLKECLINP